MFDPKSLLPVIQSSFPKATPEQLLEALTKLSKAHPELSGPQALAALQHFMQQKKSPTMGSLARMGRMI
jgi:hypothetical protein